MPRMFGLLTIFFAIAHIGLAVDHGKFRTCAKTGFCRRRRNADTHHGYVVAPNSLSLSADGGALTGTLHGGEFGVSLTLTLQAYASGASRLRITETHPLHGPRWEPNDILEPELPVTPLRAVDAAELEGHPLQAAAAAKEVAVYAYAADTSASVPPSSAAAEDALIAIQLHPFKAMLYRGATAAVTLNPGGRFYFEHHRKRDDAAVPIASVDSDVHGGKTIVDFGEDGLAVYSDGTKQKRADDAAADAGAVAAAAKADDLWEEQFGAHRDSKPFGPASVGMDITYEGAAHVYGLAEHAAPLNLPSTTGPGAKYADPYRMYTLDVYDYELDSPMALYGGVPLLLAHTPNATVGTLWFNPTETFIDISRSAAPGGFLSSLTASSAPPISTSAYWMSESGVVDVFLLPGPSPQRIFAQYAALTGTTPLPPRFALGYHQCRWNYNDEEDVRYVHGARAGALRAHDRLRRGAL